VPEGALQRLGEVLKNTMPHLQVLAMLKQAFGTWVGAAEAFTSPPPPRRRPAPARKKGARR
jgi:hypothetical protein